MRIKETFDVHIKNFGEVTILNDGIAKFADQGDDW
jgi:hypothetical protein